MINCALCNEEICKYKADITACGAIETKRKYICIDCAKHIAREVIYGA